MQRWALALLLSTVPAWAGPLPESVAGRRAVRGAPVEVVRESDELRQLREFDEESFPRPLPGFSSPSTSDDGRAAATVRRVSSSGTG
ncbi:MAG: hypothetical protein ACXVCV_16260, partial [Polyangia bacterium]